MATIGEFDDDELQRMFDSVSQHSSISGVDLSPYNIAHIDTLVNSLNDDDTNITAVVESMKFLAMLETPGLEKKEIVLQVLQKRNGTVDSAHYSEMIDAIFEANRQNYRLKKRFHGIRKRMRKLFISFVVA